MSGGANCVWMTKPRVHRLDEQLFDKPSFGYDTPRDSQPVSDRGENRRCGSPQRSWPGTSNSAQTALHTSLASTP
jgi:hypothetical protein